MNRRRMLALLLFLGALMPLREATAVASSCPNLTILLDTSGNGLYNV